MTLVSSVSFCPVSSAFAAPCFGLFITAVFSMSVRKVGSHLGVKTVPRPAAHPFQLLLFIASWWGECHLPLWTGPSGEHHRYCKPSTFHSMAFHHNFIFLPLKCGLLLFIGTFWKKKKNWQKVVLKVCLQFIPFYFLEFKNLTFPSTSFLVWFMESCLKMKALVFTLNSAGKGILHGYGMKC